MPRSAIRTSVLVLVLCAATAHAQRPNQGEDESAALVSEGRAAVKRGELDTAAKALDQAIALNPRRIEAYVLRSAVYWTRKQYKEGVQLMRRAQALAPADEAVLTALGSHLVRAGDAAAGVPLLQQVVASDPKRYDAEIVLGDHWYATGKWAGAVGAFEAYFAHRPGDLAGEDARHRVDLGDAYLRDRQPKQALAAFQAAERAGKPDLRTRLGVAWATAALDCKKARALLRGLEAYAATNPEIWLVDGRCALALGDSAAAIERGQRYLARAGKSAQGHALLGEAYEQRGNVGEARRELEAARDLEPGRRSWTVKLASVVRRTGDPKAAIRMLDQLGAPKPADADPEWWGELGFALLAAADAPAAATRLAPAVEALPTDAVLRGLLARAQLATSQIDAAVKTLEPPLTIETPRAQKLFAGALAAVAVAKLAEPAVAEAMLERAAKIDPAPTVMRDLGVAQLAGDHAAAALESLDRARQGDPSPITLMLYARARSITGDVTGARPYYDQALSFALGAQGAARGEAIEIALDWAASELAGGDPQVAVGVLEKAAPRAQGPIAQRFRASLAEARHAAGIAALRAGNAGRAVDLIKASVAGAPGLAGQCDLALAEVVTGDSNAAFTALKQVSGKSCPFPPPADVQAVPILLAFIDGLNPRRARAALDRLNALARGDKDRAGAAVSLREAAIHSVALEAASDAYHTGNHAQARAFLAAANRASVRGKNGDEIALDLALVDIADGKLDPAIAQLSRLTARLPDAWIALGIAFERKAEPQKALEAWRAARKAGARFAPLAGWIEAKERFFGGAP